MQGTEHLNKMVKDALDKTNGHFAKASKTIPYENGNCSWIQVLRFLRYKYIQDLHEIPKTRRQKRQENNQ